MSELSVSGAGRRTLECGSGDTCESFFFSGAAAEPAFGVLYRPAVAPADGGWGVLLCGPLGHEHDFSRRMFGEFARRLSAAGFPAMRFDYRGHGDSSGRFEDYAIGDFLEDLGAAYRELQLRAGVSRVVLCGLRFGATLAALWAETHSPGTPLVLWEPVLSGQAYLKELRRVELVKKMAARSKNLTVQPLSRFGEEGSVRGSSGFQIGPTNPRADVRQEPASRDGRSLLVEGHVWTQAACQAIAEVEWQGTLSELPFTRLIVRLLPGAAAERPASEFEGRDKGEDGDRVCLVVPPLWYGPFTREYRARCIPEQLFSTTVDWIRTTVSGMNDERAGAVPEPEVNDRCGRPGGSARVAFGKNRVLERPVDIVATSGVLRGIVTLPEHEKPSAPFIIFAPQGFNPRAGWNRLYVRLTRSLAAEGSCCLRFDGSGFGESDGTVDKELGADVFMAIERGMHVKDARCAVTWAIDHFRPARVAVSGVCGGAVTAALLAAEDARVSAVSLLELPLVLTTSPGSKEPQPLWKYRDKLLSTAAWKKVFTLQADTRVHLKSLVEVIAGRLGRLRATTGKPMFRAELGPHENDLLTSAIRECIRRGVPMHFVHGTTENLQAFKQVNSRLFEPCGGSRQAPISECVVDGADHDFLTPDHADECGASLLAWLRTIDEVAPIR